MTKPMLSEEIRRVSELMSEICLVNDDLYADATEGFVNGDPSATQLVINELRRRNLQMMAIYEKIVRGDVKGAETDAMRLAGNGVMK